MITSREDGYELSTAPDRLDIDLIHHWLSTDAFWALGRSRSTVILDKGEEPVPARVER